MECLTTGVSLDNAFSLSVGVSVTDKNKMSTKEVSKILGIKEFSVVRIAKKCLPNKKVINGKPTFYTEAEVTVMLDHIKNNNNRTD